MYAQQKTAYEKKKDELVLQCWSKYGQRMAQLVVNTANTMSDDEFIEYVEKVNKSGAKELAALYGRSTPEIGAMNWYADELKKAQKLKTAVDIKREKDATFAKTDAGYIQGSIKDAFNKWNQKGEFEKETDYNERLKTQSQGIFSQICIEQIKNRVSRGVKLEKELSTYNSNDETFIVSFKINGIELQNKINIPISSAENFKNNWSNLRNEIDNYDWCFVANMLCPNLVTLHNSRDNAKYEIQLSPENQSDISFPFDNLEIANPYLSGFVFKYSTAKIIDQQIYANYCNRLDSIFQDYNQKLLQNPYNVAKTTMSDYEKMEKVGKREENFKHSSDNIKSNFERLNKNFEQELRSKNPNEYCRIYFLQNPDKKTEADKKYFECRCDYPKREDFDIRFITGSLRGCNCREDEYKKNGKLFISKDEFDIFYDRGDDVYHPEVEKRAVLNFLKTNSKFIESMDFQKDKKESLGASIGKGLYGAAVGTAVSERDFTNENEKRRHIISLVNECKEKPYYPQIIDLVIDTNKALNKEWTKSGLSFENKMEFYEAYICGNYKQLLKDKKKK
jgi:hypothetical protein